jgi:hypothetical protein
MEPTQNTTEKEDEANQKVRLGEYERHKYKAYRNIADAVSLYTQTMPLSAVELSGQVGFGLVTSDCPVKGQLRLFRSDYFAPIISLPWRHQLYCWNR